MTVSNAQFCQLYVNTTQVLVNAPCYVLRNLTRAQCFFGKSNWGGDPAANADFDEIKFFNRVLSLAEIISDFNSAPTSI